MRTELTDTVSPVSVCPIVRQSPAANTARLTTSTGASTTAVRIMRAFFNEERPLSDSTGTKCKETLSSKKPVLSTVPAGATLRLDVHAMFRADKRSYSKKVDFHGNASFYNGYLARGAAVPGCLQPRPGGAGVRCSPSRPANHPSQSARLENGAQPQEGERCAVRGIEGRASNLHSATGRIFRRREARIQLRA